MDSTPQREYLNLQVAIAEVEVEVQFVEIMGKYIRVITLFTERMENCTAE